MKDYNRLKQATVDETPKLSFSQIKGILVYFRYRNAWLLLAIFSVFGSATAGVGIPYFIADAVDEALIPRKLSLLVRFLSITVALAFLSMILGFLQVYVLGRLSQGFLFRLRSRLFSKLQELPQSFFTQNQTGDLLSRLNNDSDKISQFFSSGINRILSNVFTLLGILVFMSLLSFSLTIILLMLAFLSTWIVRKLTKASLRFSKASLASLGRFSAIISENLGAFKAVILLSRREDWIRMLGEANAKNAQANFKSSAVSGLFSFVYIVLGNLTQVIILLVGLLIFSLGYTTLGVLIGFLTYTQRFYAALGQLGAVWGEAQVALSAWERLTNLLSLQTQLLISCEREERDPAQPVLKLQDVSFGYDREEEILSGLTLSFQKGKTYAIIGPTGGGKSTIVALMARLADPWKGKIFMEGQNLKSLSPQEIYDRIGVILQDPFLFNGTLADNLRYGNLDLEGKTDQELALEIEKMGLVSILDALGGNLSRNFGKGEATLSLGQKQLVSFLRIVLRRPGILILDEATANIDTMTERMLEDVLKNLSGRTTQIIIAHRLTTIQRVDEVIYINRHYVRSGLSYSEALVLVQGSNLGS